MYTLEVRRITYVLIRFEIRQKLRQVPNILSHDNHSGKPEAYTQFRNYTKYIAIQLYLRYAQGGT